jgi:hypothetical protein
MKKIILISATVFISFVFASCKKCVTCSYEYEYLVQTQTVAYPQECGSSKKIKEYKDMVKADANRHGVESSCETE